MRRFIVNILLAVLVVAPGVVIWQRQAISDWYTLRTYTPPAEVTALADKTTMTDKARKIFYITKPQLQSDKTTFRQSCTSAEKTIVLGCYKTAEGIFVYAVNDLRLNGVQEVTAAHEMLHAAYERLSSQEQSRINGLVSQQYAKITDERLRKNVESYRERDPSVVSNELHSILGTEVDKLSPELETYYSQYFTKRQSVVALSQQYEAEFSSREDQVAVYDTQLKTLKKDIDTLNQTLDTQDKQISSQKATMDGYKASNSFAQYNALVPSFNSLVKSFNANVASLKAKINQYNALVNERNAVVSEEQDLLQAIDTRIPATK